MVSELPALRRQLRYPAELQAHIMEIIQTTIIPVNQKACRNR